MKWMRRTIALLVLLACALLGALVVTAQHPAKPVGFQLGRAIDQDGRSFPVGIWYPTTASTSLTFLGAGFIYLARDAPVAGTGLPMVVVSHGNAGGPTSHTDLALALASAGYVVAAPMHPGDNYADQRSEGTVPWLSARSAQMRRTTDYMLTQWRDRAAIDPQRIGAFGFSAGGITVLTSIGAAPDLRRIASHCATTPEFICDVLRTFKSPLMDPAKAQAGNTWFPDQRIKAAVLAAPGLAFTLGPNAFDNVHIPIQLWSGAIDHVVPDATNSAIVRKGLAANVDYHSVAGAGHYAFLAPCGLLAPPAICNDEGHFDRKAFHALMNASVIAFFNAQLKR